MATQSRATRIKKSLQKAVVKHATKTTPKVLKRTHKTARAAVRAVTPRAKTKRKIVHLVTKRKLVKKKTSARLTQSAFVAVLIACTGSLAFAVTLTKPTVEVNAKRPGKATILVNPTPTPLPPGSVVQSGRGSWYALGLPAPDTLTCASTKFPRGSYLEVTNLYNGKKVICRVNDYGPEKWTNRVIDLSRGSFRQVENLGRGTIPVEIRIASGPQTGSIDIPNVLGQLYGYSLCTSRFSAQWCDNNRQSAQTLQ